MRDALETIASLLTSGEVSLDVGRRGAVRTGRPISLTSREFEMLAGVAQSVESTAATIAHVRDEDEDPFNTKMRVTLMTLSRKLTDPDGPDIPAGDREPRRPRPDIGSGAATVPPEPASPTGDLVQRSDHAEMRLNVRFV